ncbi:P-loop NTPase fold protein, partial [Acinetobacter baumannii]
MKKIERTWTIGESYLKDFTKIILVIDNVDRCSKETAYELITNIKNFLGKHQGLVFIVPVDDDALKRYIKKGGDNADKEAEEFL